MLLVALVNKAQFAARFAIIPARIGDSDLYLSSRAGVPAMGPLWRRERTRMKIPWSLDVEDRRQLVRGILMGGADIIPGVSGGTVALILGIYQRLVTAISHFDQQLLRYVGQRQWSAAAAHVDLRFLVTLGCGILAGVASLASLMHHLLEHHQAMTLAGFFGLILASSWIVARSIAPRSAALKLRWIIAGVAAALLAFWLVGLPLLHPRPGLGYTFFCGMVAICAMILPGISGAAMLLLLGRYEHITGIIKNAVRLNVTRDECVELAVFAMGCAIGLIAFSKVLKWLLAEYPSSTMAILCGLMIGSLRRVWPFQEAVGNPELRLTAQVWPNSVNGQVVACALIATAAFCAVLLLKRWSERSALS